jgi:uncharacterized protein YukE
MTDLLIPSEEAFETQAQLHDSIRDSLQTFISAFDPKHNTIIDHLDPAQVEQYTQWWQNLRGALTQHASFQDNLAKLLRQAKEGYYTVDQQISTNLKPRP